MTTLREGRVNASLTIQIYNQVFRFINAWAFNRLITADTSYYTRAWGARLKSRIGRLQAWAERQGLEVSADCQLALISQAADLLHVSDRQICRTSRDPSANIILLFFLSSLSRLQNTPAKIWQASLPRVSSLIRFSSKPCWSNTNLRPTNQDCLMNLLIMSFG